MSWPYIILTLSVTRRPSITLTTESHHREDKINKTQNPGERDLHISAPRRPWHNWVLPGGPGFPDADIPKLLLTNERPVFCQVTNEEPGSVVWLWHIPPISGLLHHLITSIYPHQVNNDVMLPCSGRGLKKEGITTNRQLGIFKFKRQKHQSMLKDGSKDETLIHRQ